MTMTAANNNNNTRTLVSSITKNVVLYLPSLLFSLVQAFRAKVYDVVVLRLTTAWYRTVLTRLPNHSTLLDVGIGTAGALLACRDLVQEKNIRIVGIDYDAAYISQAQSAVALAGLEKHVSVVCMSVYDLDKRLEELQIPPGNNTSSTRREESLDAVYFSGSFSLLPNPMEALTQVSKLLAAEGKIYITQTYQRRTVPLLGLMKPLLWYITTIDFGKLITDKQAKEFFEKRVQEQCGLELEEHSVIHGSVDTFLQAAYLTILKPNEIV